MRLVMKAHEPVHPTIDVDNFMLCQMFANNRYIATSLYVYNVNVHCVCPSKCEDSEVIVTIHNITCTMNFGILRNSRISPINYLYPQKFMLW